MEEAREGEGYMTGPGRDARLAEIAERKARRARLIGQHGEPERISNADALALAMTALVPVEVGVTADSWIHASIYRDDEAADAWLESNLVHHGHPALARVPLPDGRVVGILDLRLSLERDRKAVEFQCTTLLAERGEAGARPCARCGAPAGLWVRTSGTDGLSAQDYEPMCKPCEPACFDPGEDDD
jgi:hypothetical protein